MKASASWKRCAGSLRSARITTASSAGDTAGLSCHRRHRLLRDLLERDRDRRLGVERQLPGQQLVEHDPDRVQVGARVDGMALRLLRREVLSGAHDRAGLGHLGRSGARDPEVRDLRAPLVVDDHVVRLDVAVHDPAPVREARGLEDLQHQVDGERRLERPVVAHDLLEVAAGQELHRDVVGAVPLAAVEHADDVRVLQPGGARGLAPEALDELGVLGEAPVEQLQRDLAAELGVLGAGTRRPCRPSRAGG